DLLFKCVPNAGASTARKEVNRDDSLRVAEPRPRGVAEAGGSDDGRVRCDSGRDHRWHRGRADRSVDWSSGRDHGRCEVSVTRRAERRSPLARLLERIDSFVTTEQPLGTVAARTGSTAG